MEVKDTHFPVSRFWLYLVQTNLITVKNKPFLILIPLMMLCCQRGKNDPGDRIAENIKKQVIRVAEAHIIKRIGKTEKLASENGFIVMTAGNTKCLIKPSAIITGMIDDDERTDAIVPLYYFEGQSLSLTEHLVMIKRKRKFVISRVFDAPMKVMAI